ncbi:DUF6785 family protein [Puniceicoccus vermicola]|uniref:Uncharacterized protein n=1 Tax=Puniceicoccus vermicola TaxID=388746 RepID=A0A7X1E4W0_9BACT|nr:DUF6785 family protein [Puniceicoccus vermicola]MBC2602541.1 hypothetical protein [Puniceicoccus vermicola]
MNAASKFAPAFTARSLVASIFAMLASAILINYVHVVLVASSPGEHALVIPGLWVFLAMVGLGAIFFTLFKVRILSRPELLCVLYAILISGPMMTQGFWHRIVAISSTIPRTGDFAKMDAYSDNFWPSGANLLADKGLQPSESVFLSGNSRFETVDHSAGEQQEVLVLENEASGEVSSIRFTLPLKEEKSPGVMPGTPYLSSVLLRPSEFQGDSRYFVRMYADDSDDFREILYSRIIRKPSVIHPQGFQREGLYGFEAPRNATESVTLEIGLEGPGVLYVADPQLQSVLAMEQVFSGRTEISESDYAALPEHHRHGLVVRPDNLFSLSGLRYLVSGYIPWDAWWRPILAWGGFLAIILLGTLSIAVIMRRKWIDSERFSLPLTRIPTLLIGSADEPKNRFLSGIWRNSTMWLGFSAGLIWCLLKMASFYNSAVPDPSISVPLGSYFGPEWGETWNITFTVMAVFVSLAVFIELNILFSFLVGFFLFRLLYWYGYVSGMDASPGFPYAQEQQVGAYLAYALLILWFSRTYFREVLKEAVSSKPPKRDEIFSYRTALILLVAVFAASAVWANWVGISILGVLAFMVFLLTIGFVAMRIRAECGIPFGYFTPNNAALFILLLGGIGAFGPGLVVFTFTASFFITVAGFFLIPGAQLEILELGRRYGIRPKHILYTCLLGILGGIIIGGWSFLSTSYAFGGDSLRFNWAFEDKPWYFSNLNQELAQAGTAMVGDEAQQSGIAPSTYGYLYGAIGATILTVLRQLFAGFWFHPLGFILGSTHLMGSGAGSLWGSILAAWLLRLIVVKLGGAETVRTKLLPFFAGVFIASVLALLLNAIYAAYLRSQGVEIIFSDLL